MNYNNCSTNWPFSLILDANNNLVTVYVFEIQSIDEQTLVKPEGAIMNGQFRETDNNGHTRQMAQTNRNTKCS